MKQEFCKKCNAEIEYKNIGKKYYALNAEYESTVFEGKIIQFQRLHTETCPIILAQKRKEAAKKLKALKEKINNPEDILNER